MELMILLALTALEGIAGYFVMLKWLDGDNKWMKGG